MMAMNFLICACLLGASTAVLVELDSYTTQALDKLVREDLVLLVVERVNDSVALQKSMQTNCANKINTTSNTCQSCLKALPTQSGGGDAGGSIKQVLPTVLPVILSPAVDTGKLLKYLADTATQSAVVKLFGKNIGKLGEKLGSTAKQAGDLLLGGAKDVVNGIGDGFKNLGKELTSLTSDIGQGLDNFASSVAGLGSGFEHTLESIGGSLTSGATDAANAIANTATDAANAVKNTAENIGNGIKHGVESIGHSIGHIFGKRSACPNCDKIQGKNPQQIIGTVCGADYMNQQNQVVSELNHMKEVYSAAVNTTIIHKVEYDPTSIDTTNGVQFTKVFITYTVTGNPVRYSSKAHLRLTDLPTMAEELAMEIYESYV